MYLAAPAIIITNANLSYQNVPLFTNLNLTIMGGKCTCILGPSGVGKTSLLRLIAGLAIPQTVLDKEDIAANNIQASDALPLRGRVAYMAQTDLLMPWLSLLENVLMGVKLRGEYASNKKYYQEKAMHLLEKVGLVKAAQQRPASLSGGMRQRAALVRTLLENHVIVLMDEPFAALDAITRLRLQDLAAELLQNRTVLLVTHDPLEALRLGDIIHVLSGSPAKLDQALIPRGIPPRDLSDPELFILQAELLQRLRAAHEVDNC